MNNKTVVLLVVVAGIVGCVVVILGGCLIPTYRRKIIDDLKQHVLPKNGSKSFQEWKTWNRFKPVYRYFYFFHVLNPEQIVRTGKNASVVERGPYVYRVSLERRDVSFTENGSLLSYRLYKKYSFERNLSNGSEDDIITVVNLPILNLAFRVMYLGRKVQKYLKSAIKRYKERLFSEVRVSDVLWGYENQNLSKILKYLEYKNISVLNDTMYGLMYQAGQPNRTTFEGVFETSTDIRNLWEVKKWNGKRSLNAWKPKSVCNELKGSDGYSWPPEIQKDQSNRFIFDSEWCRWIRLSATKKQSTMTIDGITTSSYSFMRNSFTKTGENECFCHPIPKAGKPNRTQCLEKGVVNVTTCKDNIPLVLSLPHFLGAAKTYLGIRGVKPNWAKHSTKFYIEPFTGELVKASRKLQLNAFLLHLSSFSDTIQQSKPPHPFPIVWMKEEYSMSDSEKNSLKLQVLNRRIAFITIPFVLIAFGSALLILPLGGLLVFKARRSKVTKPWAAERQPLLK